MHIIFFNLFFIYYFIILIIFVKDGVRSTFNFKKELKATHHEDCGKVFMRSMDVFDHRGTVKTPIVCFSFD